MYGMKWRFLDSGTGSAFFHMALDEAIVRAVSRKASPPTFRIFEWEPAAVTFGFSQKAASVLDLDRCDRDGVMVTRRLTGGRAVLHDREIAYSIACHVNDPHFGGTVMDVYRKVSQIIIGALSKIGVEAEWSRGDRSSSVANGGIGQAPCFLSASRYEITIGGRKLVGSAQRRFGNVFLQQGSILIGPGHERIVDYLADRKAVKRISPALEKKSVDLESVMRHSVDTRLLKYALYETLQENLEGADMVRDEPALEELEYAHRSITERYGSKGWVLRHEKNDNL